MPNITMTPGQFSEHIKDQKIKGIKVHINQVIIGLESGTNLIINHETKGGTLSFLDVNVKPLNERWTYS